MALSKGGQHAFSKPIISSFAGLDGGKSCNRSLMTWANFLKPLRCVQRLMDSVKTHAWFLLVFLLMRKISRKWPCFPASSKLPTKGSAVLHKLQIRKEMMKAHIIYSMAFHKSAYGVQWYWVLYLQLQDAPAAKASLNVRSKDGDTLLGWLLRYTLSGSLPISGNYWVLFSLPQRFR